MEKEEDGRGRVTRNSSGGEESGVSGRVEEAWRWWVDARRELMSKEIRQSTG